MASGDGRFPFIPAGDGPSYSIIGELITFKVTSAETGGAYMVGTVTSPPGGGPPLHTHPASETFVVLEGEFEFSGLDDGVPFAIRGTAGDTVYIPGGAAHTYKNVGAAPGTALGVLTPGDGMERFFKEAGVRVEAQTAPAAPAGPPSEEQIAQLMAAATRNQIVFLPPQEAPAGANGGLEARHG
jgi:quercetin dioxygenase-like cupin family protein